MFWKKKKTNRFDVCNERVLVHEGGYVFHPKDSGGPTMNGITQRTYDKWLNDRFLPSKPVKSMTPNERDLIYHERYWLPCGADRMPVGVDYAVYDAAVNSGVAQAIKWLQQSVGVKADGIIGTQTLKAVGSVSSAYAIVGLCELRLAAMLGFKGWAVFGKGWEMRVENVKEQAIEDAKGT
jgi:lysozyme family protein